MSSNNRKPVKQPGRRNSSELIKNDNSSSSLALHQQQPQYNSDSNLSLTAVISGDDMESSKMFTPDAQYGKSNKGENIMVFVRVRPMNSLERAKHAILAVDCPGGREVVVRDRNLGGLQKTFTYDKVFGPHSKQIDVYKAVVSPLLEEVLMGYNCTVFAYGQTGTGKTFTMEGERGNSDCSWESDPLAGIVPRAMSQLFDELRVNNSEFTVRVSLLEMYNEEVYDLLSPCEDSSKPRTVRLYEDSTKKGSVTIQNLEEVIVHNKHEVYAIMERGSQIRKTASTLLNANSSRSHTVFTVTVHIKESSLIGEDLLKIGKLHLVDLAGSENIGRSGAVDKRAREAGNINQSLLTLGRVITALVEKAPHVPYRESKLTRLLQDSLGGRTKTSIIATISPASINLEETLSTLDYAFRAKNIQNKPEVNQKLTKKAMLREYTEEIERLRKDLNAAREKNGIYVDKENYERMLSRLESQDQDLSDKIQFTKNLEEQMLAKDTEINDLRRILEEHKDDLDAANALIDGLKCENSSLSSKLDEVSTEKEEMEYLVNVRAENENKLRNEASILLHTAADSTVKLDALYTKLDRKKSVEASNYEAGKRFRHSFDQDLKSLASQMKNFQNEHAEFCGSQRMTIDEYMSKKEERIKSFKSCIDDYFKKINNLLGNIPLAEADQQLAMTQACNEVASSYETVKGSCGSLLNSYIRDELKTHVTGVRTEIVAMINYVRDIKTDIDNTVDKQLADINEFVETQVASFRLSINCLNEGLAKSAGFFKETTDIRSDNAESHKKFITEVSNTEKVIIEQLAVFRELVKKQADYMDSNLNKTMHLAKAIHEEYATAADEVKTHLDSDTQNTKSTGQDLSHVLVNMKNNVHKNHTSIEDSANTVEEKLINFENSSELFGKKYQEVLHKGSIDLEAAVKSGKAKVEKQGQAILQYQSQTKDCNYKLVTDATEHLTKVGDEYVKQQTAIKDDLSNHCNSVSDVIEDYHQHIFKQSGQLNEFWDSTYLLDMPTGATPPRKAYDFPRNLTTTSPHQRILARFRSRVQSIPESDSEVQKDDDSSTYSDCSSDSVTSGGSDIQTPEIKENTAPGKVHSESDINSELVSVSKPSSLPSATPVLLKICKPELSKPAIDSSKSKSKSKHTGSRNNLTQHIHREKNAGSANAGKAKNVLRPPNM